MASSDPDPALDLPLLPLDVLTTVARAGDSLQEMRGMRGLNKTWQQGFELAVTGITISLNDPMLPSAAARRFPGLLKLDLGNCSAEESWLEDLPKAFPRLKHLVLGRRLNTDGYQQSLASRLSDGGLQHIQGLPLVSLQLAYCRGVTSLGSNQLGGVALLGGMPLVALDLSGCYRLSLAELVGLPLTQLSLRACDWVEASDLEQLRKLKLPLAALDLSACGRVAAADLTILHGLPLAKLSLGGYRGMTYDTLEALKGLPLTDLTLFNGMGFWRVSGAGLLHLRGMPLKSLRIEGSFTDPNEGLRNLVGLPLTTLKVRLLHLDWLATHKPELKDRVHNLT